jgi:hypothetical protein
MSEALGLVNARPAILLGKSRFSGNAQILASNSWLLTKNAAGEWADAAAHSGRTVALTLKLDAANGWTRARPS